MSLATYIRVPRIRAVVERAFHVAHRLEQRAELAVAHQRIKRSPGPLRPKIRDARTAPCRNHLILRIVRIPIEQQRIQEQRDDPRCKQVPTHGRHGEVD